MIIVVAVLTLICFGIALILGLFGVLQDLLGDNAQDIPIFRDTGPVLQARSQFAWQSRSHFREPD